MADDSSDPQVGPLVSSMWFACNSGDISTVRELTAKHPPVLTDHELAGCLYAAADQGHLHIVQHLLSLEGRCLLDVHDIPIFKLGANNQLVLAIVTISSCGLHVLHLAICKNDSAIAMEVLDRCSPALLQQGAYWRGPRFTGSSDSTLLFHYCKNPETLEHPCRPGIMKRIVEVGGVELASLRDSTTGMTCLHYACQRGNVAAVHILLQAPFSSQLLSLRDHGGLTCVHSACLPNIGARDPGHKGCIEAIEAILTSSEHGRALITLCTNFGDSVLHLACRPTGSQQVLAYLLGREEADGLLLVRTGLQLETCLHVACKNQQSMAAKMLLEANLPSIAALRKAARRDGRTGLHLAVMESPSPQSASEIIACLLGPQDGRSALLLARETEKGLTCLHQAVLVGCEAIIQQLAELGGQEVVLALTNSGDTCLSLAVSAGMVNSARFLAVTWGPRTAGELFRLDPRPRRDPRLHAFCMGQHVRVGDASPVLHLQGGLLEVVAAMFSQICIAPDGSMPGLHGRGCMADDCSGAQAGPQVASLWFACNSGDISTVRDLTAKLPTLFSDKELAACLYEAADQGHLHIVQHLLSLNGRCLLDVRDTPILELDDSSELVFSMVITIPSCGIGLLHLAMFNNYSAIAMEILDRCSPALLMQQCRYWDDDGRLKHSSDRTILFSFCGGPGVLEPPGRPDIMKRIVEVGGVELASLRDRVTGMTCLHYACRSGNVAAVHILLQAPFSSQLLFLRDHEGLTCVHSACLPNIGARDPGHKGCIEAIEAILTSSEHGRALITLCTNFGDSVLHLACRPTGSQQVLAYLLGREEADGLLLVRTGLQLETCLHVACKNQQSMAAKMLLEANLPSIAALRKAARRDGRTGLHLAVMESPSPQSASEIIACLLGPQDGRSALLLARETEKGLTCLHQAVLVGCEAIIQQLAELGGQEVVLALTNSGDTCLSLAVSAGMVNSARFLAVTWGPRTAGELFRLDPRPRRDPRLHAFCMGQHVRVGDASPVLHLQGGLLEFVAAMFSQICIAPDGSMSG